MASFLIQKIIDYGIRIVYTHIVMDRLEELSERIKQFNEERDWDQFHSPSNLAKSISIEVGELLECFQWSDTEYNRDDVVVRRQKKMGMTSNTEIIKKLTGLSIGKVFLNNIEYDAQTEGDRQFDYCSGNFHLFPAIEENQSDNLKSWKSYLCKEKEILDRVQEYLSQNKLSGFGKIDYGSGTLTGIPEQYKAKKGMGINSFFRTITVKKDEKDKRCYVILLKRFYIDKDNKVNCIFGKVQFYSSLYGNIRLNGRNIKFNGNINEDDTAKPKVRIGEEEAYPKIIHYPKSYKAQNEKMIRCSDTKQKVVVYNPKIQGNIVNGSIDSLSKEILERFYDFVNCVEKTLIVKKSLLESVIKQDYTNIPELSGFDSMNSIGKCLIYKSNPKWFYECDSSKVAVEMYSNTGQRHSTEKYDTITSWLEFAKTFLGFKYTEGINVLQNSFDSFCKENKVEGDRYKKWTINRINKTYPGTDEEGVNKAYQSFLNFSESVYSIGNMVPVGYSPKPIRRNDRWDCKIQWIYNVCITGREKDDVERRSNKWKEFLGKVSWERYVEMYFLQDFLGENYDVLKLRDFPKSISEWTAFFDDTWKRVAKREERIFDYLQKFEDS